MTVPQVIAVGLLAFLNGFAVAVVLYRHYVMKPRWETESELRKELKTVRGDLYVAKHGRPVDHKLDAIRWAAQMTNGWMPRTRRPGTPQRFGGLRLDTPSPTVPRPLS